MQQANRPGGESFGTVAIIETFAGRPALAPQEPEGITEREREVLTLIARGLTSREMASEMVISVAAVKAYVGRLLTKLDAGDRVQLVILAYDAGPVSPSR
ncbi:response regulator transcription factor [Streptosporangium sandarakinum]|uniref:response regulator transcription factor n=1 Tax=Streptosporangium sandarakinum TaxID=1260955 RepID=UPI0036C9450F